MEPPVFAFWRDDIELLRGGRGQKKSACRNGRRNLIVLKEVAYFASASISMICWPS